MDYIRRALGMKPKDETPVPSKPSLTADEVYDVVRNHFLIKGLPSPSNQQIADILGRTIEEVNVFRPPGPYLHTRYDDKPGDESSPIHDDSERMKILAPLIGTEGKSTPSTQGGRKNHKTISNKNKKKHKKLSRRRRHHSKKNRKSMKRK